MQLALAFSLCFGVASASPPNAVDRAAVAIASVPGDPPGTNNDTHYLVSNERRFDLFHASLPKSSGGVLIGVGAEQLLILAGWTRPDLVVAMDFDPMIVDLQRVHAALLRSADDPVTFVESWRDESRASSVLGSDPVLMAAGDVVLARALSVYRLAARPVSERLVELRDRPWRGAKARRAPHSFLTDSDQYAVVRALATSGRLVAVQGDLTGDGALPALAAALREHGLAVRTLYLSNAEQYFMYGDGYRRNVLSLPMDEDTVVLRTLPGRPRDFEYQSQRGRDFQAWLRLPRCRSVYAIRGLKRGEHLVGETTHRLGPPPR